MPANLPPQYFEVEKKLKSAKDPKEKIVIMEDLLAIIPKHKGTEKLQALYKTKIAKLRQGLQKKSASTKQGLSFYIDKTGAGQIILIGAPNTGKSMLIKALTNAEPEIGEYPFTTHAAKPAMMNYENIQIQLIDTPPITQDYFEFWQAEMIKSADGILVVIDMGSEGGLLDFLTLLEKLREKRIKIFPADKTTPEISEMFCKKALILANKMDHPQAEKNRADLMDVLPPDFRPVLISASRLEGMDDLKEKIYHMLRVLRVYSKTPGKKPSMDEPFIFKQGSTVIDMAHTIHRDFTQKLKFARIWSKGKYQGQKVTKHYVLQDEDVIELHI